MEPINKQDTHKNLRALDGKYPAKIEVYLPREMREAVNVLVRRYAGRGWSVSAELRTRLEAMLDAEAIATGEGSE